MRKTHYDPYEYSGTSGPEGSGEYYCPEYDNHMCGTPVNHDDDIEISRDWNKVTCKRCLKQREAIDFSVKKQEEVICEEMGKMADWWEKEGKHSKEWKETVAEAERWNNK